MGHRGLLQNTKYKKFIGDRDKALEQMHQNAQTDISRLLFNALTKIEKEVLHLAVKSHKSVLNLNHVSMQLENATIMIFAELIAALSIRMKSLRRSVYAMSYLSQIEAIGQSTQRKSTKSLSKTQLTQIEDTNTILGEKLNARIWLDVMHIRSRIMQAFRLGIVQELPAKQVLDKVKKTFPKIQVYKRPPRTLSPIREADHKLGNKKTFSNKMIDEDEWNQIVEDYKYTHLPASRFDNEALQFGAGEDSQIQYNWELEQSLTEDFVNQVRQGDVAAAKDLGIQEFIWVAILDDKTDDCCAERNGLTTSEIKEKVDSEDFESDCDALYPPAHFNCRCQISPVASAEEVEGPNWASFNDWLNE